MFVPREAEADEGAAPQEPAAAEPMLQEPGRELGEIPMLQADKPLQQSAPADDEIHPNMVLIPGGTFRMGSDKR